MSFKHALIAHGEKIAVAATLLLCALEVTATLNDESMKPSGITTAKIDEQNAGIDKVFAEGKHPILKPVPDYIGELNSRFTKPLAAQPVDSWLLVAPDRGPAQRGFFPYVFEAPAPILQAKDSVGAVALTITLPEGTRPAGRRLADGPSALWQRPDEGVTNSATVIGVFIESRAGDATWKPVKIRGANSGDSGFIAQEDLIAAQGQVVAENIEPWVKHFFRASTIVRATGLPPQGTPSSSEAVLVVQGRLEGQDETYWQKLTEQVKGRVATTLSRFAPEIKPPAGVNWPSQTEKDRFYRGQSTGDTDVPVSVTADVRFAFSKIGSDPKDPTKEVIRFLVTKLFTDSKGGPSVWLGEPKVFTAAKGDVIGGKVQAPDPRRPDGSMSNIDLATGFKVVGIERNKKRILFYEIKERARPDNKKGRDLDAVAKEVSTDVVLVENLRSKVQLSLVRLGNVKIPAKTGTIIYPAYDKDLDEDQEFRKNPGSFTQYGLEPVAPVKHQADTGPLKAIQAKHPGEEDFYTTDTVYYEFADGRLVWYEPLNKRVRTWPEVVAAPVTDSTSGQNPPAEPGKMPPLGEGAKLPEKPAQPSQSAPGGLPAGGVPKVKP